jgi:hypothetical protein
MTVRQLRLLLKEQPFKPFTLRLTDGRSLEVSHPDFLLLPQGDRNTTVVYARPDGLFDWVYLKQVISITGQGLPPAEPVTARGESEGD